MSSRCCKKCDRPISSQSLTGHCRWCARRLRDVLPRLERGSCLDCGSLLGIKNRSGRCSHCQPAHANRDPAFQKRRVAGIKRKWEDPEFLAKMRKIASRMGQKAALDEDLQERRRAWGKYAYANWLGKPEVRARALASPTRARTMSETRLAWCPPEMRQKYRDLKRRTKMRAAEAKKIILREWADIQAVRDPGFDEALFWLSRISPITHQEDGTYRFGYAVLTPSEVIARAKLKGWEPSRWAA